MSSEQALKELGLAEHQLRFTCRVHLQDTRKEQEMALRVYSHLKRCVSGHIPIPRQAMVSPGLP